MSHSAIQQHAELQQLAKAVLAELVGAIGHVQFEHVRREFNQDADRLANEAMDEAAAT